MDEILAIFLKEWRTELRARNGLFVSFTFSLLSVVAMGFACSIRTPSGSLGAGLFCLTLLFAAVVSLPRTFLSEEDQGTFELLRTLADPGAAFTGKMLFATLLMLLTGALLGVLFPILTGLEVKQLDLYIVAIVVECLALGSAVSLCGALVLGSPNRWVVVGVLALPLLIPQLAMAIGAFRAALGDGFVAAGWQNVAGLGGYALASVASGPSLVGAVWRRGG